MEIRILEDLNMPLGKSIAQASHAIGKAWLDRFENLGTNNGITSLKLTKDALEQFTKGVYLVPPGIKFTDSLHTSPSASVIVDSGRTVFNKPTTTCSVVADYLGPLVSEDKRLQFSDNKIDYKQGLFINRKSCKEIEVSIEMLVSVCAGASLWQILKHVDENGEMKLSDDSAIYKWLTSSFGKTAVGTKKDSKFDFVCASLRAEYDATEIAFQGQSIGFCSEPIKSEDLQIFTRSKTFRLLDSI